jgi:hypothetical protein
VNTYMFIRVTQEVRLHACHFYLSACLIDFHLSCTQVSTYINRFSPYFHETDRIIPCQITKSQNRKTDNLPTNQHARLSDIREKLVKVRASVSVMVLLGLAWILGPIMLLDMVPALSTPITYLFTVCNSLQVLLSYHYF